MKVNCVELTSAMNLSIAGIVGLLLLIVVDAAVVENAGDRATTVNPDRRQVVPGNPVAGKHSLGTVLDVSSRYGFILVRTVVTALGKTKQKIQLTFDNIKVLGINIQATYDATEGYNGALTGQIVRLIENDIADTNACVLTSDELFTLGKAAAGIANCVDCNLVTKERVVEVDDANVAHLAYTVDIIDRDTEDISRPYMVIDACNTAIIYILYYRAHNFRSSNSTFNARSKRNMKPVSNMYKRQACAQAAAGVGGNPKTSAITYGTTPYCLDVTMNGVLCVLENTRVRVVDLNQGTDTTVLTPYEYDCTTPDDTINEATSANLDAFFYGTVLTDIFFNTYGIDNPTGSFLTIFTHYGTAYENAFWNGDAAITGDGDTVFYPLVALDSVTHEVAHGIGERYSGLHYIGQSGGINEAFCDITGETMEALSSYRTTDWKVGIDIVKDPTWIVRYFEDPTLDTISIAHLSDYTTGMDEHTSSGIFNKAFYQMVIIQTIPIADAYRIILLAAQIYWGVKTEFIQAGCDVQSAAADLGYDVAKITAAFAVVGIDSNTNCPKGGGGLDSMDTLSLGISQLTLSTTQQACFLLLPRSGNWYYYYLRTTNNNKAQVSITIKNASTGVVIGTRITRSSFSMSTDGSGRIVCITSDIATTIDLKMYYCGRFCYSI